MIYYDISLISAPHAVVAHGIIYKWIVLSVSSEMFYGPAVIVRANWPSIFPHNPTSSHLHIPNSEETNSDCHYGI